jgi:hypothetical protein
MGLAMAWDGGTSEPDFYSEAATVERGPPNLLFTKPFIKRATPKMLDRFSKRFNSVAGFFPEVRGEIKIGITTSYRGLAATETKDQLTSEKLCFPPLRRMGLPTRYVIGHELMHIVQAKLESLPETERSCDVFTLARLPPSFIDHPPTYLRVPREVRENWRGEGLNPDPARVAHELAIEAIITREKNPRYIQWWESEFSGRMEALGRENRLKQSDY